MNYYRASFTLPVDQARLLSDIAKQVGASQSLVLSVLLKDLHKLSFGLDSLVGLDCSVPRRANGQHAEAVTQLIRDALVEGQRYSDLFDSQPP